MGELPAVALSCIAGAGLGVLFFGGLWWTIRRAMSSRQPALWFGGSVLARTGLAVTGFYFVAAGDWKRLAAGVAGFLAARLVVTRVVKSSDAPVSGAVGQGSHAP